ncbi:ribosomal protein S5 domain 2-type protein [Piptocephalis cylindrospora]|uniref:Ribosomal protein S5 domain 2-type protein n=1 Tax=Piptocephalis cylindrospora TaxID=1907219 RepID=A0A4P9Y3L8_9FUNG|nr:ribosomal protein S5 domain 2-type protein [Piptocephalis cylindrospora]|eukprot:RKP13548.1 ribosomal protein S5 domain 2-type protein [Piptocephalis cylindrospora]
MTDRRRIQGPEMSVPPLGMGEEDSQGLPGQDSAPVVIGKDGLRNDGRLPEAPRPMFLRTGLVTQASGSAFLECGRIKAVAAVYGPRQEKRQYFTGAETGRLYCEFKFSTFSGRVRRGHQRDALEKEYSQFMQQALAPAIHLDLLPKSAIDIYVQILEEDGSAAALAAAITVASTALADAGIEMLDMVTGCAVGYVDGQVLVDCTAKEAAAAQGELVLSRMPSMGDYTHIHHAGSVEYDLVMQAVEVSGDTCAKIHGVVNKALLAPKEE